jgi:hypothetical protein
MIIGLPIPLIPDGLFGGTECVGKRLFDRSDVRFKVGLEVLEGHFDLDGTPSFIVRGHIGIVLGDAGSPPVARSLDPLVSEVL